MASGFDRRASVAVDSDLKVPRSMGVGLNGMRERVRQFGGELVLSHEEPGTKIEARIPLYGTAE
jgi:signal transduction histidine kinase